MNTTISAKVELHVVDCCSVDTKKAAILEHLTKYKDNVFGGIRRFQIVSCKIECSPPPPQCQVLSFNPDNETAEIKWLGYWPIPDGLVPVLRPVWQFNEQHCHCYGFNLALIEDAVI
jgi:hypothetical protein